MSDVKVIGIDVGKKELHVAHKYDSLNGKTKIKRKKFLNTAGGHKALVDWSIKLLDRESKKRLHFIMEATGVYYERIATLVVSRVLCKIVKGQFFKEWQVVTHFSDGV